MWSSAKLMTQKLKSLAAPVVLSEYGEDRVARSNTELQSSGCANRVDTFKDTAMQTINRTGNDKITKLVNFRDALRLIPSIFSLIHTRIRTHRVIQ